MSHATQMQTHVHSYKKTENHLCTDLNNFFYGRMLCPYNDASLNCWVIRVGCKGWMLYGIWTLVKWNSQIYVTLNLVHLSACLHRIWLNKWIVRNAHIHTVCQCVSTRLFKLWWKKNCFLQSTKPRCCCCCQCELKFSVCYKRPPHTPPALLLRF